MRIMTIIGTRPEIIRLSLVIPLLDRFCHHILVHTGQNYDDRLSEVFFNELEVRRPDVNLGVKASGFAGQIGQILERTEALFLEQRPDRLLILGDTNSGLAAIIARRLGIPVYHMEAGNRCYDDRVPEEVNRRVIDHSSSVLMPYTNRSRENLLAEGFPGNRVYVTGNPIKQVTDHFSEKIAASTALEKLRLERGKFFLVTLHRAENVDLKNRLSSLLEGLTLIHQEFGFPVVCSLHPRTRSRMKSFGVDFAQAGISFLEPFGFFDFIALEKSAFCLLSDSGTVQEEACIFGVPNVTIRDVTERPETLECGSNMLCGVQPNEILAAVRMVTSKRGLWRPPDEYMAPVVAETVCRIVLGYRISDAAEIEWQSRPRPQ
jgi:UDP-N-acetylglucosamine 2-epimerase (non-hydrolysing)